MKKSDIATVYATLAQTYPLFDDSDDPWMANGLSSTPFKAVVSAALSTMTQSSRVIRAALALYEQVSDFEDLAAIEDDTLRELIRPVAHYNRKTVLLKRMAQQILDEHDGNVPHDRDALMALPGIGRKVTDLILNFEFGELTVGVDTHVHRLVNRLGMVDTTTHEQTADGLMKVTPKRYQQHAHEWLIQHGMNVCTARKPHCGQCVVRAQCQYAKAH